MADQAAESHLALGATESAFRHYEKLLDRHKRLAQSEPERPDYQRNLSVSHSKMGDLYYEGLGQVGKAREAYQNALGIRERLAQAEPERADYQRDLAISLWRVGEAENPADIKFLKRALSILKSLKDGGRLATTDEGMIPELKRLIENPDYFATDYKSGYQRPAGPRRLIVFMALLAALLILVVAWFL